MVVVAFIRNVISLVTFDKCLNGDDLRLVNLISIDVIIPFIRNRLGCIHKLGQFRHGLGTCQTVGRPVCSAVRFYVGLGVKNRVLHDEGLGLVVVGFRYATFEVILQSLGKKEVAPGILAPIGGVWVRLLSLPDRGLCLLKNCIGFVSASSWNADAKEIVECDDGIVVAERSGRLLCRICLLKGSFGTSNDRLFLFTFIGDRCGTLLLLSNKSDNAWNRALSHQDCGGSEVLAKFVDGQNLGFLGQMGYGGK